MNILDKHTSVTLCSILQFSDLCRNFMVFCNTKTLVPIVLLQISRYLEFMVLCNTKTLDSKASRSWIKKQFAVKSLVFVFSYTWPTQMLYLRFFFDRSPWILEYHALVTIYAHIISLRIFYFWNRLTILQEFCFSVTSFLQLSDICRNSMVLHDTKTLCVSINIKVKTFRYL